MRWWPTLRGRRWPIALGIVALAVVGYVDWHRRPTAPRFVTAEVTRGPVVRAITTTGAVDPVITVVVGAYVSGTIQSTSCDYNTRVKAGQLCAKIDPRPYQVIVDQDTANLRTARAQLEKDRASLAYAKINYDRDVRLHGHGIVSQDNVDSDKSTLDQAAAQVKLDEASIEQRQAELHAAEVNLAYTDIVSPVDGTVVARNITLGQTVAASFQTPTLFLIAQDLTKMQVDTNVSESDVGAAKVGQKASFTIEAYPGRTFWGEVSQVREAPITVQNVVTYDVVVNVDNPDFALLPGMTANTRIITEERDDVLRVPVRALRFSPRGVGSGDGDSNHGQSDGGHGTDDPGHGKGDASHGKGGSDHGKGNADHASGVWVLRDGQQPERISVGSGLTDGNFAEIVHGDLKPGDRVVVDEVSLDETGTDHGPPPSSVARPHFHP